MLGANHGEPPVEGVDVAAIRRSLAETDVVIQRAVERTLMNLIQVRIDLAQHVWAANGLSSGGTRKGAIQALGELGISA